MNKELIYFLEEEFGCEISFFPEMKLEKDLGLYGEEAYDFILRFSERFNVDVSKFNIDRYFSSEGDRVLWGIMKLLKKNKRLDVSIKDLEKAVVERILV